jgi:beta-xylosidase
MKKHHAGGLLWTLGISTLGVTAVAIACDAEVPANSGTGGAAVVGGQASPGGTPNGGTTNAGGGGGTFAAGGSSKGGAPGGGAFGGANSSGGRSSGGSPGTGGLSSSTGGNASIVGTNNPVLPGLFADPNVTLFDNTFYIYPTTDGFADWGATSFGVFSSINLVQWTNRGVILDVAKDLKWASGHAWAPTVARVGSTYYFYFTADNQIGVATSLSPTGPFNDALGKPLVANSQYGVVSIDPYVFIDDDGRRYLYFGNGGLRVAQLNADMVSFSATPTNINPSGATGTVEGSALFKRNGTYYLQWSEGDTRLPTYRVAYGRAQSPLGPFTRLAVILEQDTSKGILGPGGSTVLAIPSRDEYYIVYHRFKIPGGDGTHRETCIDRLYFNTDGTIVPVKPTLEGLQTTVLP